MTGYRPPRNHYYWLIHGEKVKVSLSWAFFNRCHSILCPRLRPTAIHPAVAASMIEFTRPRPKKAKAGRPKKFVRTFKYDTVREETAWWGPTAMPISGREIRPLLPLHDYWEN